MIVPDLRYILSGEEIIGWAPAAGMTASFPAPLRNYHCQPHR
jgi:hypothetical protein